MKTQTVSVVSIHPDPANPLSLDIKQILAALGSHLQDWIWCVRGLDWLGENADSVCQRVDAAAPDGLWMTSDELVDAASRVYQTIEGTFLAFPRVVEPDRFEPGDLSLQAFPTSPAELAIAAVDGGFFEVYTKDQDVLTSLRELGEVHGEDVNLHISNLRARSRQEQLFWGRISDGKSVSGHGSVSGRR